MKKNAKPKLAIYLAGGLFNAGERLHNLYLEKALIALGYKVILPQREALKFFKDGRFDVNGIVNNCQELCTRKDCIFVGSADGADADSGMAVEYGMAIVATKRAVIYRTDFRTAIDRELGVNAMLAANETQFVYEPCFFTKLSQVEAYYKTLAANIHQAIYDSVNGWDKSWPGPYPLA